MRQFRKLPLLQILAAIVLALMLAWQLASLSAMKGYIQSGLQSRLSQIASLVAQGLKARYDLSLQENINAGLRVLRPEHLNKDSLFLLHRHFAQLSTRQSPVKNWIIVLPSTQKDASVTVRKYEAPGSYFRSNYPEGLWTQDETLARFLDRQIPQSGNRRSVWKTTYWETAVDSSLRFLYRDKFLDETLLIGFPIFGSEGNEGSESARPLGFLFIQAHLWYLAYPTAREYLNHGFWEEHGTDVGFDKNTLDLGLLDSEGRQLLNLGREHLIQQTFESHYSLALLDPYLSQYTLAVGFRGANTQQLAQSIYHRNLFLVIGLFALLGLMLWVIFRSTQKSIRLSQLKSDFLAQVSHEIRTPLAGIRLAQDTIRLGRAHEQSEIEQAHEVLDHESKRIEYMVDSFLDFARSDSGEQVFRKEGIPLEEWRYPLIAIAEMRLHSESGLELHVEDRIWEGVIMGDRMALEQILFILLDNAIKYSGMGHEVRLRLTVVMDHFVMEVQDEGIGIAAADQEVIFDRFVRLGDQDAYQTRGHGMGLFIARSIANSHQGTIRVESKPGKGTTFTLSIPLWHE